MPTEIKQKELTHQPVSTYVDTKKPVERIKGKHQPPQEIWKLPFTPAAKYVQEDVLRANYNRAARITGASKWNGKEVTQEYLPDYFTEELRDQIDWLSGQRFGTEAQRAFHFARNPNDTIKMSFTGDSYKKMYGSKYANANEGISDKLRSRRGQVEHTLGAYNVYATKDGDIVKDTYDFNVGQGNYSGNTSLYATLRRALGQLGSSSSDSDDGKIKFNVNLKR